MKTLDELQAFYDATLKPQIQAMEQRRQSAVNGSLIAGVVLAVVGLGIGGLIGASAGPVFILFPTVIGILIGVGIFKAATSGYREEFKNTIVRGVIEFLEPGLRYRPELGIPKEQFRAADIFRQHIDRYRCEDLIEGLIGQTDVRFSEVHAEYKTTSSNGKTTQTTWHTIFKGIFFIADFHKHFHGRLLVLPDAAQKLFGNFGQTLQSMNFTRGSLIKLEDPEFEKEFVVYGDDQVEARYILSTSMMQRILDFQRRRGKSVYLSFQNSCVIAAFSTDQNFFEPRLFDTADFDAIRLYAAQLRLAADITEELNLNTRIWSKE